MSREFQRGLRSQTVAKHQPALEPPVSQIFWKIRQNPTGPRTAAPALTGSWKIKEKMLGTGCDFEDDNREEEKGGSLSSMCLMQDIYRQAVFTLAVAWRVCRRSKCAPLPLREEVSFLRKTKLGGSCLPLPCCAPQHAHTHSIPARWMGEQWDRNGVTGEVAKGAGWRGAARDWTGEAGFTGHFPGGTRGAGLEAVWAGATVPPLANEELGVPLGDAAFSPGGRRAPAGSGWPQSGIRSQPPNSPAFAFLPQTDSHRIRGRFPWVPVRGALRGPGWRAPLSDAWCLAPRSCPGMSRCCSNTLAMGTLASGHPTCTRARIGFGWSVAVDTEDRWGYFLCPHPEKNLHVCVCMCVYMCLYVYICACTCEYMCVYVCVCACMCLWVCACECICAYVCLCTYV